MIISAMPMTVFANEAVSYIERSWNDKEVIDTTKTVTDYELVTSSTATFEDGKYYVVSGNITNTKRIVANGTVHLILTDGSELNVKNGINVTKEASLFIYGQNENSGKITASVTANAGIGGNSATDSGSITIHGGAFNINRSSNTSQGAAIGAGGFGGDCGDVTIYNGNLTLSSSDGSGIGAGTDGRINNINIYDGNISVSTYNGSCLGCGHSGFHRRRGGMQCAERIDGYGL